MKKSIFMSVLVGLLFLSFQVFSKSYLQFYNTHTFETFSGAYKDDSGNYIPEALKKINNVLRDHRTNEVHAIDVHLLDVLSEISSGLSKDLKSIWFHVISGYRSPSTNNLLRKKSKGVYHKSAHMKGRAIDIRVPGIPLKMLRNKAASLKKGGVGYYPDSNFIHVDIEKVKSWGPF
ncbi:MAG: hypothetical protein B7Y25_07455 [Alphaproteobacteria bacterium 16-39-46]|nr:MAG: hypothetical protein B7Y25_07455 [Alphaproteobacteria bacterium 16-39-46]OZA41666.1 MAG: hypothetical protein B7X84_07605 [Alphaproteobacteria bacterium 17-39-52]HQS84751.1 DUF882 domain-containing protein [Alphaproteobacteria bacterium]HQS94563.1 DUF882 domain-containing protein [Alphaproteobacteria bacterium]